jgi:uncharacterized protein YeaO (DUF488 family)
MVGFQCRRVYDPAEPDDGLRVLVDRVWPRGMTKARVQADLWLKDIAPFGADEAQLLAAQVGKVLIHRFHGARRPASSKSRTWWSTR